MTIECPTNCSPACLGKGVVTLYKCDCPEQPAPPVTPVSPYLLTEDLDLYVSPSGDDTNDGLSADKPLKTINAALEKTKPYSRNGYLITINLAGGTYPEKLNIDFQRFYNRLALKGVNLPVIEGDIVVASHGRMLLEGVHIQQSATSASVNVVAHAYLDLKNCQVTTGAVDGEVIFAQLGGLINIEGSLRVKATSTVYSMISAAKHGLVTAADKVAALAFEGSVRGGTIVSRVNSFVHFHASMSMTGAVTGARYLTANNGVLCVSGGTANSLPGTTAGTNATGGQYMV